MAQPPLVQLDDWLELHESELVAQGISVSAVSSDLDRNPASKVVDFERGDRSARVVIWSNGQAQLNAGDHVLGVVELDEYQADINHPGLSETLARVLRIFD